MSAPLPFPRAAAVQATAGMAAPPAAGLAILVWSADWRQPERAATPFVTAQAAAALELQVELLFTAEAVQWLLPERAGDLLGFGAGRLSAGAYLQTTAALGVRLLACSQALHAAGRRPEDLVPACAGLGGITAFVARGHAPGWSTLVF